MTREPAFSMRQEINQDIQGLRGVAVLLVVVFHAWPLSLPGGYIGVDVFFVISGYLITRLIYREIEATGRLNLWRFYARRIRRLLPASLLVVAATALVAWIVYAPGENRLFSSTAIATAAYLSNVWFALQAVDYLSPAWHMNPLLHTWSLAVEEQFYVFWPTLILLASSIGRRSRARVVIGCIATVSVLSLIGSIYVTSRYQAFAFFSMPTRVWEFGLGALIALGGSNLATRFVSARYAMAAVGALAVFGSAFVLDEKTAFPGWAAIPPVIGAGLLILATVAPPGPGELRPLRARTLTWFGNISYSLYLWHWPVLVFSRDLIADYSHLHAVAAVALSVILGWASYRWVEQPVRLRRGTFIDRPYAAIAGGLVATVFALGFVGAIRFASDIERQGGQFRPYASLDNEWARVRADGCHHYYFETNVNACEYGSVNSDTTVMLFGDSHAAHWFPALEALANKHGWRLVSLTKATCPVWDYEPYNERLFRRYTECSTWRNKVYQRIQQERPKLLIVLTTGRFEPFLKLETESRSDEWADGIRRASMLMATHSEEVIVLGDTPWPGYDVPKCLSRAARRHDDPGSQCLFDRVDPISEEAHRFEAEVVKGLENVSTIDTGHLICRSLKCPTQVGEMVTFIDDNHLSKSYVISRSNELFARFPARVREKLLQRPETLARQ